MSTNGTQIDRYRLKLFDFVLELAPVQGYEDQNLKAMLTKWLDLEFLALLIDDQKNYNLEFSNPVIKMFK